MNLPWNKPKPKDMILLRIEERLSDTSRKELENALKELGINAVTVQLAGGSGLMMTKDKIEPRDMAGIQQRFKEIELELYPYQYHA